MALRDAFRNLGPGLLLAATSIGGSHLVMAPTAGARFGTDLLWLVLVAHLFKYHTFEFGPRFAVGTGTSLLAGYMRMPGPRGWVVKLGLVDIVLESVGVVAAVAGLTGAILHGAFPALGIAAWTVVVLATIAGMLVLGRYQLLTRTAALMLGFLTIGTIVAFFARPPSVGAMASGMVPSVPAGSLLLVSAILGWMPTGVAVSIWHSLWILEDPRFAASEHGTLASRFRAGLRDMRLGYVLSAVLGVMFLGLGATVLHPRGLAPEGPETALTLSRLYTEILGPWMQPVFLTMAFFAMFSTTYTVMDGLPRTLVAAVRHLRDDPDADRADRGRLYWGYMAAMTVTSLVVVGLVPDPVILITALGAVTFVFSPLYCIANYVCVTRLQDHPELRPGRWDRGLAMVGIVFMTGLAGLFLYTELLVRVLGWG